MLIFLILLFIIFALNVNGILNAFTGGTALASPLILILLFLILNILYKKQILRTAIRMSSHWIILLLLYFLIGMISLVLWSFYNEQIEESVRNVFTTILVLIALGGGMYYLLQKYRLQQLIGYYTVVLITSAACVILLDLFGVSHIFNPKSSIYRQSGFFGNPNDAGHLCSYSLLFILFKLSTKNLNVFPRVLYLISAVVTIYASLLTLSKTSMATCLVLLGLYIMLNFRKNFKSLIVTVVIGIVLILTQWDTVSGNMSMKQMNRIAELENLMQGEIDENTTSGRSDIAEYGWGFVEDNIITGIGLGNFKSLPGLNKASHNSYLVLWGESGIIPFLLFLYLLLYQYRKGYNLLMEGFNNYGFLLIGGALVITVYGFATNNLLDNRVFNCSLSIFLLVMFLFSNKESELNKKMVKYDI